MRNVWIVLGVLMLAGAWSASHAQAPVVSSSRPAVGTGTAAAPSNAVRPERSGDSQALVEMLQRLDELQTMVQMLRGDVDQLAHEIEGIKQRQRDLYLDVDRRMQRLESAGTASAAPSSSTDMTSQPSFDTTDGVPGAAVGVLGGDMAPGPAADANPAQARQAYEAAFNTLRGGNYEAALSAFERFLAQYPGSELASNAQYWLGETNYVTRRFGQAETEFKKVLENYPASPKLPDAMLKLGFTYYELGKPDQAEQILNSVKQRFPTSAAARLANERMLRMKR